MLYKQPNPPRYCASWLFMLEIRKKWWRLFLLVQITIHVHYQAILIAKFSCLLRVLFFYFSLSWSQPIRLGLSVGLAYVGWQISKQLCCGCLPWVDSDLSSFHVPFNNIFVLKSGLSLISFYSLQNCEHSSWRGSLFCSILWTWPAIAGFFR